MRVLIAVPTFENILPDTFKSIYGLSIPDNTQCCFDFIRGYHCALARNKIAKCAIDNNFDYVLMVDSDIILPSNALVDLLSNAADICLGCYPRKNTTTQQVELFKPGQYNFVHTFYYSDLESFNGKFVVKGGGFGCALIRTSVFKRLSYPWFKYVEYDNGEVLSEDNYFCDAASHAGITIYADSRVRCGHSIRSFQWE